MASLQFPLSLSAMHAWRRHRFSVSCSGGGGHKPPADRSLDRRNMLLRLGGLCGAANLISDINAHADPIHIANFNFCSGVHDVKTGDPLDVNCCLPVSDTIVDYKLPTVRKLRVRSAAHKIDPVNIAKYKLAVKKMRDLDKTDPTDPRGFTQQANIHCAYCNGPYAQAGFPSLGIEIHNTWLFFPFHRWYLYFHEIILGSLIDDPDFTLPFWNWDNPEGMQMPRIFDDESSPLYDANRNPACRNPAIVNLNFNFDLADDKIKVANNLSLIYNEMVRGVSTATDFMGPPYRAGDRPIFVERAGTLERGSHNCVHSWVGDPRNKYREDMGNFYSAARDPVFFSHHANVDRIWAIFTTLDTDVEKAITHEDYLNASFLFYDENKQLVRVRVADCQDYRKMGYEYEEIDTPWRNHKPPKKAAAAKIEDLLKDTMVGEEAFPLTLSQTARVLVPKTAKGKADEVLVLENIQTDPRKLVKFDVFVNDGDDEPKEVDRAEYAGSFAQLPHRVSSEKMMRSSISLRLKEVYEDIDIGDDDALVVTIVPRFNCQDVTIGGITIKCCASLVLSNEPS